MAIAAQIVSVTVEQVVVYSPEVYHRGSQAMHALERLLSENLLRSRIAELVSLLLLACHAVDALPDLVSSAYAAKPRSVLFAAIALAFADVSCRSLARRRLHSCYWYAWRDQYCPESRLAGTCGCWMDYYWQVRPPHHNLATTLR